MRFAAELILLLAYDLRIRSNFLSLYLSEILQVSIELFRRC